MPWGQARGLVRRFARYVVSKPVVVVDKAHKGAENIPFVKDRPSHPTVQDPVELHGPAAIICGVVDLQHSERGPKGPLLCALIFCHRVATRVYAIIWDGTRRSAYF